MAIAELIERFTGYKDAVLSLAAGKPCSPDIFETSPDLKRPVERAVSLFRNISLTASRSELDDAMESYFQLLLFMSNALEQPEATFIEHHEFIVNLVDDFIAAVKKYPRVFLALAYFKSESLCLPCHSINVLIFSIVLATTHDLSAKEIQILCLAGLLHDIGVRVDKIPMSHLASADVEEIKTAICEHHEWPDQSGSLKQTGEHSCSKYARVLAIADLLDTMISP